MIRDINGNIKFDNHVLIDCFEIAMTDQTSPEKTYADQEFALSENSSAQIITVPAHSKCVVGFVGFNNVKYKLLDLL